MQTTLPDNFPIASLPPTERYKLEAYYGRFVIKRYREYGTGHLWLACYAALPAVMTPDLLYKIWLNFSSYLDGREMRIQHVAVADLLLSPLFQEISYETYEMPVELKNALLQFWQSELNDDNYSRLATLEEVAKFLLGYTKVFRTNDAKSDDAFREAQEITAWSYLDTQRASAMLLKSLEQASQNAMQETGNRLARAEQLRLLEVARLTSHRHDLGLMAIGQSKHGNIQALAGYSQQLQNLLTGKEEDVLRILQQSGSDLQLMDSPGSGISIKAPSALVKKTQPEEEEKEKIKLFLLLVGIDQYADTSLQLRGCINDVQNFQAAVEQLGYQATTRILTDKEANIGVVEESLTVFLEKSEPHDQVLFFFAGHTTRLGHYCNLVLFDSEQGKEYRGITLQQIFSIYNRRTGKHPFFTIILDTELEQLASPSPKISVITGGGMEGEGGSRFINALLPIWTRSKGRISLQKLVAAVRNQLAAANSQTDNFENQSSYSNSNVAYQQQAVYSTTRSDGTDRLPDLFAFPEAAQQPLVRSSSVVRQMQALLRSIGYSNGSVNGVYNQETDTALRAWLSVQNITGTPSPEDILHRLQEEKSKKEREDPKIMLFVFSNPDGQLPFVGDEQERLFALADDMEKRSGAEMILLNNPSREELRIYFTEPTYRNQLMLFHFSGFEADPQGDGQERGMFLQKDGEKDLIDYGELHQWLDFQENIRLFYLNTCYSSNLAKTLTIRGVQAAIGAPALVDDRYASNFALEFYQKMLTGLPLKEAFDRIEISPSNEGQHRMVAPNEGQEFARFQLFSDWGRREAAEHWRWGRVEEQAQVKEEKPRKSATGLYLETLKELLNENEVEAALDRLEKYDGLLMLDFAGDLLSLKSRYLQTKKEFEGGKLPQAQYERNINQVRFSLQNIIEEIPRKMAIQKSTGEARWMDFTLPAEEDMVKFEKREELLEWIGKGLEAVKSIGKIVDNQTYSLGFLLENESFICNEYILPNIEKAKGAKIGFFFSEEEILKINKHYEVVLESFINNKELDYSNFKISNLIVKNTKSQSVVMEHLDISGAVPELSYPKIGDKVQVFRVNQEGNGNLELFNSNVISVYGNYLLFDPKGDVIKIGGSPIYNMEWKVQAMYHRGILIENGGMIINEKGEKASANQGVLIAPILQDIQRQQSGGTTSYAA